MHVNIDILMDVIFPDVFHSVKGTTELHWI